MIDVPPGVVCQVYTAVYAPHTGPFLFLCAVVPPAVALLATLVIRPIEGVGETKGDEKDKARLTFLYVRGRWKGINNHNLWMNLIVNHIWISWRNPQFEHIQIRLQL